MFYIYLIICIQYVYNFLFYLVVHNNFIFYNYLRLYLLLVYTAFKFVKGLVKLKKKITLVYHNTIRVEVFFTYPLADAISAEMVCTGIHIVYHYDIPYIPHALFFACLYIKFVRSCRYRCGELRSYFKRTCRSQYSQEQRW